MKFVRSAKSIGMIFVAFSGTLFSQDNPPQKEHPGSQAGSSGKSPDQMGSKDVKQSPLKSCDSGTAKKKDDKKKKSKKPDSTKSGDSASRN